MTLFDKNLEAIQTGKIDVVKQQADLKAANQEAFRLNAAARSEADRIAKSITDANELIRQQVKRNSVNNAVQIDKDVLEYDYYEAAQCQIYLGNILVDDISFVSFTLQNTKRSIYGYASKIRDTVATGRVVIEGAFSINFKETAYLHIVMEELKRTNSLSNPPLTGAQARAQAAAFRRTFKDGDVDPKAFFDSFSGLSPTNIDKPNQNAILRRTIEELLDRQYNAGSKSRTIEPYLDPETGMLVRLGAEDANGFSDRAFEDIAETLEDNLWNNGNESSRGFGPIVRPDEFPQFDIFFVYGDMNNPIANHTVHRLFGVEIHSMGQQIQIDNGPLQEVYTFSATDLL